METSESPSSTRDRKYWTKFAMGVFGPLVELIRVSSFDRDSRFVVAYGNGVLAPAVLGAGSDWASAVQNARTTDEGKLAIQNAIDLNEMFKKQLSEKIKEIKEKNDHQSERPADASREDHHSLPRQRVRRARGEG